jgi:hypothetical protein
LRESALFSNYTFAGVKEATGLQIQTISRSWKMHIMAFLAVSFWSNAKPKGALEKESDGLFSG